MVTEMKTDKEADTGDYADKDSDRDLCSVPDRNVTGVERGGGGG